MEYFRFSYILLMLKISMKTENSRNCEHFQENEDFGSYETSHCNNLVGAKILEI
jgi:hypothetical protein